MISFNEFVKYQKKCINKKDIEKENFIMDKTIKFINSSIDSFEEKSNKSYDNKEVKIDDLMRLSIISINNSENNEEMIIVEDNIL